MLKKVVKKDLFCYNVNREIYILNFEENLETGSCILLFFTQCKYEFQTSTGGIFSEDCSAMQNDCVFYNS